MNEILMWTHSLVRWLVVILTVAALAVLVMRLVQRGTYDALAERVMRFFSISVALQWVVGLVYFVALGLFNVGYRWEHLTTMTLALVAAHGHYMVKKRPARTRLIVGVVSIVLVLILVFVGVWRLPQGWRVLPTA